MEVHHLYVSDDGYYYTEEDARQVAGGLPLTSSITEPCLPGSDELARSAIHPVFYTRVYRLASWAGELPPPGYRHYTERPNE